MASHSTDLRTTFSFPLPEDTRTRSEQAHLPSRRPAMSKILDPREESGVYYLYRGHQLTPQKLVKYNRHASISCTLTSSRHDPGFLYPTKTAVVFVAGACHMHHNSNSNSMASYGVYFGPDSQFNRSARLTDGYRQGKHVAEIKAAIVAVNVACRALDAMLEMRDESRRKLDIDTLVIITNSEYLTKAMTQYIDDWHKNDWRDSDGYRNKNKEMFLELEDVVYYHLNRKHKVELKFWLVSKDMNPDANRMAKKELSHSAQSNYTMV